MSAGRLHWLKVSGLWGRLHRAESETLAGLLTQAERDAVQRRLGLPALGAAAWVPVTTGPRGGRFAEPHGPGALYLASGLETCIAEVAYHHGLLCSDSLGTPVGTRAVFRHLVFQVDATLADATRHGKPLGHASNYGPSWAFGRKVRHAGLDGVHFSSVRAAEGHCLALFVERAVVFLRVEFGAVILEWDGAVSHRIA